MFIERYIRYYRRVGWQLGSGPSGGSQTRKKICRAGQVASSHERSRKLV